MSELNPPEPRTSGRYKMNEEDKARPVPLKLHQKYIDRLEWLEGKTTAEKIRNMIDSHCGFVMREKRQMNEVRRRINPLYRLAKTLTDPEIVQNKQKFNSEKERFLNHLKALNDLIDLYYFNFEDLKQVLDERDLIELEIVFNVKKYITQ